MQVRRLRSGLPLTEIGFGVRRSVTSRRVHDDESLAARWTPRGIRHPLLRHRAALRPRPVGAAPRGLAGRPARRFVVSTKVGRLLVRPRGRPADTEGFAVPATHRASGLQPRRRPPLPGVQPDPARARPRRHRLRARPGRPVPRDRVHPGDPGADRAARAGRHRRVRRGDEPTGDAMRFHPRTDLDVVMVAGRYTLLDSRR